MARLPTAEDLGQGQRLQSQSVVPINLGRSEQAQARAAEVGMQAGQAVSGVGRTLFEVGQRIQEREDRVNYAREKSNFLQSMVAAETEVGANGDTDYKTFGTRFNEKTQKAKQEAAAKIQNPAMRAQFEADADLDIQQGVSRMAAKSWALEADNGRAMVQEVSARNRELAMRTRDPKVRESLLHNTQIAIQTALQNGYIDPTQAEEWGRKTAIDYAMAYVNTQHPSEQLRLLKESGGMADLIPSDVRKSMEEKAMSDLASEHAAIDRARKLKREELMNSITLSIEKSGNMSQVTPDAFNLLDTNQRKQVLEHNRYIAEGRSVPTDPVVYNDLWTMASNPETQHLFIATDLNDYLTRLSKEDRQELTKEQAKLRAGGTSDIARGFQSTNQMIDTAIIGAGLDPSPKPGTRDAKAVSRLRYMANKRIAEEKSRLGKKELSSEEERNIIDQFFIPKTTENESWMKMTPIGFALNKTFGLFEPEKKRAFEFTIEDISDDDRKVLEESLTELERPVTDDNILDLWLMFKQ